MYRGLQRNWREAVRRLANAEREKRLLFDSASPISAQGGEKNLSVAVTDKFFDNIFDLMEVPTAKLILNFKVKKFFFLHSTRHEGEAFPRNL